MTEDLVIIGSGGHAREMLDVVDAVNAGGRRFNFLGFLDEATGRHGVSVREHQVVGGIDWLAAHAESVRFVVGIGNSAIRRRIAEQATNAGARATTLVHPLASLTRHVSLGEGTVLTARVVLTSDISIGRHVHVNIASTVSHDSLVRDFATLGPGTHLAGNVTIGEGSDVGLGASVIQGVAVGEWGIVGAGAVVIHGIPANATAVGVPARVIATRPAGWHLKV